VGGGEGTVSEDLSLLEYTFRYVSLPDVRRKFQSWVTRGTGTPKDREEINRREF
jgi:hypothetical protein